MTITITVLDDAVRVAAGDKIATLHDPNPKELAKRIRDDIRSESPIAQVITVLPERVETPIEDIVGKVVEARERPLLSPAEVASRLGVSRDVVYDHIRSGDLATIRIGTGKRQLHRIAPDELDRFLDQNGEMA